MVLAEVLIEKCNLELKICQLNDYVFKTAKVSRDETDKAVKQLVELVDKHRSHLILLNKINNEIEVIIGDTKVSLANAILITKTINHKIDLLNGLIAGCDGDDILDFFSLVDQRDKLLDEYTTISNGLKSIEWSTEID
jgi:hypothetical protein